MQIYFACVIAAIIRGNFRVGAETSSMGLGWIRNLVISGY